MTKYAYVSNFKFKSWINTLMNDSGYDLEKNDD